MKDAGSATLDSQGLPREELPEMLELEDEFEETGLEPLLNEERGLEPLPDEETPIPVEERGQDPVRDEEEHQLEPGPERRKSTIVTELLSGPVDWCLRCGARHSKKLCLGEVLAKEPERHGWRVAVDTTTGRVVHGVLLAPTAECWRSRIMTFPRTLWVIPGGTKTLKFVGADPGHAERQAITFIQEHCKRMGHKIVDDPALIAEPDPVELEQSDEADAAEAVRRKLRSVLVRFGPAKPDRRAETADLSQKGLFIATTETYARGTQLHMLLEISGARIPLRGCVQWTRGVSAPGRPEGMGVRLIRPPAFYVQFVRKLP